MTKIIYSLTMLRSCRELIRKYDKTFWNSFRKHSKEKLAAIIPLTPDIGKSVFAMNNKFVPAYIAWYQAFMESGLSQQEAWENIWMMSEKMITTIPKFLRHSAGKAYLNGFRKKLIIQLQRQQNNELHPYDWQVTYREISENTFELDFTECAIKKLAHDLNAEGVLPGLCRLDYLLSHFMGHGFERTKTLGDGDECCNCRYHIKGICEWSPEKGFELRR